MRKGVCVSGRVYVMIDWRQRTRLTEKSGERTQGMSEVRRRARAKREQIGLALDAAVPAAQVLAECEKATGVRGGLLPDHPPAKQRIAAAHAFAHLWLHGKRRFCTAEEMDAGTDEAASSAISKVGEDTPQKRREEEASVFAAELLLPHPLACRLFWEEGLSSAAIAEALGMPAEVVQRQLADALLLPPPTEEEAGEAAPASAAVTLDPFQAAAAQIECGPLLLGAGPGTGKTKTLVGRCQFLTQTRGVPAEKILALTFSRKAAQEMRGRLVAAGVGTEDAGPWVGTFHAFGLEVLRRFGDRLGLTGEIKLLDALDAVTLLENHLAELNLDVLDNLYDPAIHLGGILGQIGRAKDEICPPERYAMLCRAMEAPAKAAAAKLAARTDRVLKREQEEVAKGLERAAKAAEVAHCYAVYERLMRQGGYLDYGDLISRSVALLKAHPDVLATLQAEYPHVLADEYQDVNRACAYLVRLLAGDEAHGLWAVGDHRQSIYQFQGASPANVAAFGRDYPHGHRLELGVNYRSRRPIVDLFGAAAEGMEGPPAPNSGGVGQDGEGRDEGRGRDESRPYGAFPSCSPRIGGGGGFSLWHAHRGEAEGGAFPAVTYAVAGDDIGQAEGIAQVIHTLHGAGWAYRDQAILCRSHAQAEALAGLLAARDVPVLYLGALLERPEIKDLLSLLSLLAEPDGTALVRVAAFPEYAVPQADVLAVLTQKRRLEMTLTEALSEPGLPPGLQRLAGHLVELDTMDSDPAALLRHYLFGLSQYLHRLAASEPMPFARLGRTLAIHQLLALAAGFDRGVVRPRTAPGPPHKVREFLAHLRRRRASGDSLRGSLPAEAEALDAVRVLTAHAAKGLEFPVVFLPNLGAGQFPTRGRSDGLSEPPGLADTAGQEMDEERCLFFVALSRAREHLVLSRARTGGTEREIAPSPLLTLIQTHLEARGLGETVWPAGRVPAGQTDDPALIMQADALPEYTSGALETYLRCPRQYFYSQELKLPGTFQGDGYPQFHACVRQTLHWLEDAREQGQRPSETEIAARLEVLWAEQGPIGHLHEAKYKDSALGMLRAASAMGAETEQRAGVKSLRATLSNCHVHVRPDALRRDTADGTLIVARHRTGRPGDGDHTDKRLALYRRAAQQTHPDTPVRVELRYLADGGIVAVKPPEKAQEIKWEEGRLAKYDGAARDIQAGLFPARPESGDECQKCPYALVCPL